MRAGVDGSDRRKSNAAQLQARISAEHARTVLRYVSKHAPALFMPHAAALGAIVVEDGLVGGGDYEGEDVRDSLSEVVRMVEEGWIRPWAGGQDGADEDEELARKMVPFDKAPEVFRRGAEGPVGVLKDGGTCVVRIVA